MPFSSHEFREFVASYEFEVITSSPGYPQSNGKAKNTSKIHHEEKLSKQAQSPTYP